MGSKQSGVSGDYVGVAIGGRATSFCGSSGLSKGTSFALADHRGTWCRVLGTVLLRPDTSNLKPPYEEYPGVAGKGAGNALRP